jgi:hypothetical protein
MTVARHCTLRQYDVAISNHFKTGAATLIIHQPSISDEIRWEMAVT